MEKVVGLLTKVADYKSTVLLIGESGTGKELWRKRCINCPGARSVRTINCGAIPEPLLTNSLGMSGSIHRRQSRQIAWFEAHEGTLFLDEIAELPLPLQIKLCFYKKERSARWDKYLKSSRSVVAATSANLTQMVEAVPLKIFIPTQRCPNHVPLANAEDIPRLAQHFLKLYGAELGQKDAQMTQDALQALMASWPGNVKAGKHH